MKAVSAHRRLSKTRALFALLSIGKLVISGHIHMCTRFTIYFSRNAAPHSRSLSCLQRGDVFIACNKQLKCIKTSRHTQQAKKITPCKKSAEQHKQLKTNINNFLKKYSNHYSVFTAEFSCEKVGRVSCTSSCASHTNSLREICMQIFSEN